MKKDRVELLSKAIRELADTYQLLPTGTTVSGDFEFFVIQNECWAWVEIKDTVEWVDDNDVRLYYYWDKPETKRLSIRMIRRDIEIEGLQCFDSLYSLKCGSDPTDDIINEIATAFWKLYDERVIKE